MDSNKQIRAGVVGTGFIGQVHIDALRRLGVEVTGVVGSSPLRAAEKAAAAGLPMPYESLADMLTDERVDVVHVTSPNHLHFDQARAVLDAGKHCVCEKPLALTSEQTAELVSIAEASGLVHATNFNVRFYPQAQEARARVAAGALGDPWLVHGGYVQDWLLFDTDWNWRLDPAVGSSLRAVDDIGSHWIDLMSFILGRRVEAVMADLATFIPVRRRPTAATETFADPRSDGAPTEDVVMESEDAAGLLLRFEGGARAVVAISQVSAGRRNHLHFEVDGQRAALAWNSERPEELWIGHREKANELLLRDPALMHPGAAAATRLPGGHAEGFADTFRELYRAVYRAVAAGGPPETPDYPTFRDGHDAAVIGDAIARSAREQRWVHISESSVTRTRGTMRLVEAANAGVKAHGSNTPEWRSPMADISSYGGDPSRTFEAIGFFRVERTPDRWWMVDPDGNAFITIGLNHADETNLKYPHNADIWRKKYGSRDAWIRDGVVADLKDWGFNTIGWTQEYISGDWGTALDWFGDPIDLGHSSTPWSSGDLRGAGMPYVVQIRVQEIEDWNGYPSFRDMDHPDFEVYCDYLARLSCFDHADSKNLVGYYLVDIPAWLPHAARDDFPPLKGLNDDERDQKLFDVATKYYKTITEAIRRYDSNHLILGDRFNGNKGIPTPALEAMKPFVDVLSVQYFTAPTEESRTQMREDLTRWQAIADKPVIIADIGNWTPTELNPHRVSGIPDQAGRGEDYAASLDSVLEEPWMIGWHWCAYVENTARGWGIKDPWDEPYEDMVERVRAYNTDVYNRVLDGPRAT